MIGPTIAPKPDEGGGVLGDVGYRKGALEGTRYGKGAVGNRGEAGGAVGVAWYGEGAWYGHPQVGATACLMASQVSAVYAPLSP